MRPFEIVAGRHKTPPLTHAVHEHGPRGGTFAAGVDDSFPVGERVAPLHCKGRGPQHAAVGKDGHGIRGENLAGFADRAVAVERLQNGPQLILRVLLLDEKPSAHGRFSLH